MVVVVVQFLSHVQLFAVHGLKNTRLLFPPGICSSSCPLSQWRYLTISSSATPFSFCLQSFPTSGSFPMSHLFASVLNLKLQYFGYLMLRVDSLEKTLMLGKIEGKKRRGQQRMRWLDGITNWMDMNLSKVWEIVEDRVAWHATVHGITKTWTLLNNNNKIATVLE